eukprot:scpid12772/ scgid16241/ Monocarboxylate transporter 9; Solute carrier family 16 member 9
MEANGRISELEQEASVSENAGMSPKPTQPRWVRWTVGISAFLTLFAVWGNFYVFGIVLLPFLCEFGAGRAVTSGVSSTGLILLALFAPVATFLLKRTRASVPMYGGIIMCFLGNFLASFSPNIAVLYLTYGVILGIGSSLSYTTCIVDLPLYYPENERARAIAFCETGAVLGLITMAPLMDVCVKHLGWRKALWVFAALIALLLLPAPFAFNPKYKCSEYAKKSENDGDELEPASTESDGQSTADKNTAETAVEGTPGNARNGTVRALDAEQCTPSTSLAMIPLNDVAVSRRANGDSLPRQPNGHNTRSMDMLPVRVVSPHASLHEVNLDSCSVISVPVDAGGSNMEVEDSVPLLLDNGDVETCPEQSKKEVLTGWKPYVHLVKNSQFVLFCSAACLWYVCFNAPLVYLVDMSEAARRAAENNTGVNETAVCESSFTDSMLYIYMSLALLVCFPLGGWWFDRLPSVRHRLVLLIGMYIVTGFLVAVIPLAKTEWQFALVSVGVGVSRTPDVLHPAFLMSLLGDDLYPYAWTLLLLTSALFDAAAPPIVGALHDALGNFLIPYLMMAGVIAISSLILSLLLLRVTSRTLKSTLQSWVASCCCRTTRRYHDNVRAVRYRVRLDTDEG